MSALGNSQEKTGLFSSSIWKSENWRKKVLRGAKDGHWILRLNLTHWIVSQYLVCDGKGFSKNTRCSAFSKNIFSLSTMSCCLSLSRKWRAEMMMGSVRGREEGLPEKELGKYLSSLLASSVCPEWQRVKDHFIAGGFWTDCLQEMLAHLIPIFSTKDLFQESLHKSPPFPTWSAGLSPGYGVRNTGFSLVSQ